MTHPTHSGGVGHIYVYIYMNGRICLEEKYCIIIAFPSQINHWTKVRSSYRDAVMTGSIFFPLWYRIKSYDLWFHPHYSHLTTKKYKSTQHGKCGTCGLPTHLTIGDVKLMSITPPNFLYCLYIYISWPSLKSQKRQYVLYLSSVSMHIGSKTKTWFTQFQMKWEASPVNTGTGTIP